MPTNPRCNTSITIFPMTMTLFFFSFLFIPTALPFHFNFPSIQPGTQNLHFQGDAYADKALQLTINDQDASRIQSTGRVYHKEPMHLWDKSTRKLANFTTRFTFSMYIRDQYNAGNGFAFFLAQNGSILPQSSGGNLGLFNNTPRSISTIFPTVAVEFDTFKNVWDPAGTPEDGIDDNVGIDVNSIVSNATLVWPRSMKNGSTGSAVVSYSSVNKTLRVSLVFVDDPVDKTLRTLSHALDLRDVLPEMVFVGFSAATGASTESHKILSWRFDSTDLEVDQVSPPAPAPSSSTGMGSSPSRRRIGKGRKKIAYSP